jgi:hypothetical protein
MQRTSLWVWLGALPQELMRVYTKPHPLNCFFASTSYGAYQKALADAFQ